MDIHTWMSILSNICPYSLSSKDQKKYGCVHVLYFMDISIMCILWIGFPQEMYHTVSSNKVYIYRYFYNYLIVTINESINRETTY